MPFFTVTSVGPEVTEADVPDVPDPEDPTQTVKASVERGEDGQHVRIMTVEANDEEHAKKIAERQAEDIAMQEAYASGLENDLEVAEYVSDNAFTVSSVEEVVEE